MVISLQPNDIIDYIFRGDTARRWILVQIQHGEHSLYYMYMLVYLKKRCVPAPVTLGPYYTKKRPDRTATVSGIECECSEV